jgi:hypothetical protein
MQTPTPQSVRWSSPAASDLQGLVLQDRRAVLAATRALVVQWASTTASTVVPAPHVIHISDSTEVHYRIDGAGILIESLSSPHITPPSNRGRWSETQPGSAFDVSNPDIVLLSKVEYLALLRQSERASSLALSASVPNAVASDCVLSSSPLLPGLLTEEACRDTKLTNMTRAARSVPADGTIPQEVLERAAQNHWQLARAWREYLGLTKQEAAARASITAISYSELEEAFPQICSQRKHVIACGLSLLAEQLLV